MFTKNRKDFDPSMQIRSARACALAPASTRCRAPSFTSSCVLALLLLAASGSALAQAVPDALPDPDLDALALPGAAPAATQKPRGWQLGVEGALEQYSDRYTARDRTGERLTFDLQVDQPLAPGLRGVFSDQLDTRWDGGRGTVNTLREAYLSWQPSADGVLDVGRINARYGVAYGYNPTDFLRPSAVRSVTSIDPITLKKNRMGAVMLRGQTLWNGGSLTALFAPELKTELSDAPFSADLGATNNHNRALVAYSQQFSEHLTPQFLLFAETDRAPQVGVNLTYLLGDATVAHFEWAGGNSAAQQDLAMGNDSGRSFHARYATGLTYATIWRLSLTAEYQYNGAAPDQAVWRALPSQNPLSYLRYRQWLSDSQDLATRQSIFLYAGWEDALVNHLDLSAMVRRNIDDHSRLSWIEARYHWDKTDLALQWQHNHGAGFGTEFGAVPKSHSIQALVRYFF
jgi:hypothetical protein